ncbi:glycosyltransferase family 4 protein [Streptomyces sp. NPDC056402]|uniref:glycosyltransferase family 4 protein n=1 Tax=Streptomyces sp. NPDC056402 TaxID=3345810 RepID=UPI0035D6F50B
MNRLVATALDLPYPSPGGSVELFLDLYTGERPAVPARAFMLAPDGPRPRTPAGLDLLHATGKSIGGDRFNRYVTGLRHALTAAVDPQQISVLHLHHLAFGATPALLSAFPRHPRIAFVHGTDLLYAENHSTQLRVLREAANAADAIVVPTHAMTDRLLKLAPQADRRKIEKIPWGVPDQLLSAPPPRPARRRTSHLRVLFAGRVSSEKGLEPLLQAVAATPSIELSVAAPRSQFQDLVPVIRQHGVHVRYLGWFRRQQLWKVFADHDVLAVPSTTLEAMGLVALEAQACGLPVLYQPVPGLTEALAGTGMATDFATPATAAHDLNRLRTTPGLLELLRAAGRTNAARFPLSATASAITDLGRRLT